MTVSEDEKKIFSSSVERLSYSEDCTTYRIADDAGEVVMTSYTVFPGIDLIYNDVQLRACAQFL